MDLHANAVEDYPPMDALKYIQIQVAIQSDVAIMFVQVIHFVVVVRVVLAPKVTAPV